MKLEKNENTVIKTNILFMLIDIFIMIILNKMVGKEGVVVYVAIRLIILFISFFKRALKICFQYFTLIKNAFTKSDEDSLESLPKDIFSLLILISECLLFLKVLQYTLTSFRNSLREIDTMTIIIGFILMQLLVYTINTYISKRQEGLQA